jgi:hypothetical protein
MLLTISEDKMPSPRYIPAQEDNNWLGETIGAFINDRTEKLKERKESDALKDIYDQYKNDGKNLEDAIWNINSRTGISPTTRVNTVNQLMKFKEHNNKLQETAKENEAKKTQVRGIEKSRGLPEGSLADYESNPVLAEKVTKPAKPIIDQNKEKNDKTINEVREILLASGEDEQEAERLSSILSPASARARGKENAKKKEEVASHKVTQKAFNDLVRLVPDAGRGTEALGIFGGKNARTAGEFTSLTGALESLLVEKVNRGTLSNTRFKYITETLLPKVTDSQAEIKGKLAGLATILELDPSSLQKLDNRKGKKAPKTPEGKVRVKLKGSNPPVYGSVSPYEGMEEKYDLIK